MQGLFSYQPLFFHNVDNFLDGRAVLQSPQVRQYIRGRGYDLTAKDQGNAVPNWLSQYFGGGPLGELILPYRLPGVGEPIRRVVDQAEATGSGVSAFTKALDNEGQNPISVAFGLQQEAARNRNINAGDAQTMIGIVKSSFADAANVQSLSRARDSVDKMTGKVILGGDPIEGDSVFGTNTEPTAFMQANLTQMRNLDKILKYSHDEHIYDLVSLATGSAQNSLQMKQPNIGIATDGAMLHPKVSDRKALIFDQLTKQIKQGSQIPTHQKPVLNTRDAFLDGSLAYTHQQKAQDIKSFMGRFGST